MAALPPGVRLTSGRGGLAVLLVDVPAAQAAIYLHGATVTGWTPTGHDPVLWVSSSSRFDTSAPIRGGVPICFPWFAARAGRPESPSHGFARLSEWSLIAAEDDGESVTVKLRLTDEDAVGNETWPHRFEAVYTVVVGSRLMLALQVTNRGEEDMVFEEALHTYFAVRDIRSTEVIGLEGQQFLDRLGGPGPVPGVPDPVSFVAETDRIYLGTGATTTVRDPEAGRSVLIRKAGSDATVVWNPWVDKARAMDDFGDDEWETMVCVETCNIRDAAVHLAPGASHPMTATFEVAPIEPSHNSIADPNADRDRDQRGPSA